MDDPRSKMNDALKAAMKNKDNLRRDVIRMALSSIKQVEIDTRKPVTPEDAMAVLQKEAKKRRETIEEAQKAGRSELVEQEQNELSILEEFMPRQLARDEIVALVREIIAQTGASSTNDKGKVMGLLMPKIKGVADGKLVNQVVQEILSS
jgi:uncharacterized protein